MSFDFNCNPASHHPDYSQSLDGQPLSSPHSPSPSVEETEENAFPPSQFEIDLQALNDQISALEIGEKGLEVGEEKFDRYEKLFLNGSMTLLEEYRQIDNESDPELRHKKLQAILADLKLMNSAREDFAMLIRRDYGVDLDEAKTRGRNALIAVVEEYKQSLDKMEAIHRELSKQIALRSNSSGSNMGYAVHIACFAVKNVLGFAGDFAHGLLHPAKLLCVDDEEEVVRSRAKIQEELQVLIRGVASDKEFLARLYKTSIAEAEKEEGIYQYRGWWIDPITQRQHRFEAKRSCRENDEKFNQALAISKKDPSTLTEKEKEIMRAVEKEERYKKNVFRVVLGIHALSWGISAYRIYYHDAPLLKAQAVNMREEVKKAVPKKVMEDIDRETSFLSDQLLRNYENVRNRNFSSLQIQKFPLVMEALEKGLIKCPDGQPTDKEIAKICNWFNLYNLVKNSPHPDASPFLSQSLSLREQVFSKEKKHSPQNDEHELPRPDEKFLEAAQKGNVEELQRLLRQGVNTTATDKEECTALHLAVWKGHENAVRLLLDHKVDHVLKTVHGYSALCLALFNSHKKIAKLLWDYGAVDPYGIEIRKHKFASHSWEIGGVGKVGAHSVQRESGFPPYFSEQMVQTLTRFYKKNPEKMSLEEFKFMREAMIDGIRYRKTHDMAKMIHRHSAGLPVMIHTGFMGHAIEFVIWKEYIIINNKSSDTRKPVELYRVNPAQIVPSSEFASKIQEIIDLNDKHESFYEEWLKVVCKKFGATNSDFEKIFEESYPIESRQKVGNCAWESFETSVYALFALHRIVSKDLAIPLAQGERLGEGRTKAIQDELKDVYSVFTNWQKFTMLCSFENYLDFHKEPEGGSLTLDHDLVAQIILKSDTQEFDLYPEMDPFIRQYVSRSDFEDGFLHISNQYRQQGASLFSFLVKKGHLSYEQIFSLTWKAIDQSNTRILWTGLDLIYPLIAEGPFSNEQILNLSGKIADHPDSDIGLVSTLIASLVEKRDLTDGQIVQALSFVNKTFDHSQDSGNVLASIECIAPLVVQGRLSVDQHVTLTLRSLRHWDWDVVMKGVEFVTPLIARGPFSDKQIVELVLSAAHVGHKYDLTKILDLIPLLQEKETLIDGLIKAFSKWETNSFGFKKIFNENYLSKKDLLVFVEKLFSDQKFSFEADSREDLGFVTSQDILEKILYVGGEWGSELETDWKRILQKRESREWVQEYVIRNLAKIQAAPGGQILLNSLKMGD